MATRFTNKLAVIKALRNLTPALKDNIEDAVRVSADQVANTVRSLAPVRKGRNGGALKASVRVVNGNLSVVHTGKRKRRTSAPVENGAAAYYVLAGDETAYYAHMVEFGTDPHINGGVFAGTQHPGTTPQPFFLPAWRLNKKKVNGRIGRAMGKAVKQAMRGLA
jgi:HK97 gp10 family phage protein